MAMLPSQLSDGGLHRRATVMSNSDEHSPQHSQVKQNFGTSIQRRLKQLG